MELGHLLCWCFLCSALFVEPGWLEALAPCSGASTLATHGSGRNFSTARRALRKTGVHDSSLWVRLCRFIATRFFVRFRLRLLHLSIGLTYFRRNSLWARRAGCLLCLRSSIGISSQLRRF